MKKFELNSKFYVTGYSGESKNDCKYLAFCDTIAVSINGDLDKDDEVHYNYSFTCDSSDDKYTNEKIRIREPYRSNTYNYHKLNLKMQYFNRYPCDSKTIKKILLKQAYEDIVSYYYDIIYPDYAIYISPVDTGDFFFNEYRVFLGKMKVNDGLLNIKAVLDYSKYGQNTCDIRFYYNDTCYGFMERQKMTDIDIAKNALSCYAVNRYMDYMLKNNDLWERTKIEIVEPFVEVK